MHSLLLIRNNSIMYYQCNDFVVLSSKKFASSLGTSIEVIYTSQGI